MQKLTMGQRLLLLRKSKKLSQNNLAKKIGISVASIPLYENDQRLPSVEVLLKYSSFFEVTLDYMVKG